MKKTKYLTRKIFNTVYEMISTAVIILGLILGILYLCGIRLYHVKSGSMGELLPVGCVCFVSTYSRFEEIQVNDVISFQVSTEMFVTHRAVKITDEGVFTKGDKNQNPDPNPVTSENYIGKTVFAIPYIGVFLEDLRTPKGLIILSVSITVLFVMGFFYRSEPQRKEGDYADKR